MQTKEAWRIWQSEPPQRRDRKKMANEEQVYIEERADGKYAIRKGNSERASAGKSIFLIPGALAMP